MFAVRLTTKNTFIDAVSWAQEEREEPPLHRTRSDPTLRFHLADGGEDAKATADGTEFVTSVKPAARATLADFESPLSAEQPSKPFAGASVGFRTPLSSKARPFAAPAGTAGLHALEWRVR
ncbi:unnamed protein product [Prorocentrum cordatum]|uniref:Coatomer subunit delta n=1 Tax=Prorocentrum cordatum TaxID=2364126 RepID=A0ABN9VML9_9DINO|nr:unnamed protein product [Polarella glacialis]